MKYRIEFLEAVVKEDLKKIDPSLRKRIYNKLEELSNKKDIGRPLHSHLKGLFRIRVGSYRIVYKIVEKKILILVIAISKREDLEVYKISKKRL
jgi:mRNA interferase RelE/StbE